VVADQEKSEQATAQGVERRSEKNSREHGLRGLNLSECRGVGDCAVTAVLRAWGSSLEDLCAYGCPALTSRWVRSLEPRHALKRLNYAGSYKMEDDAFLPLWHRARPNGILYTNPNAFFFALEGDWKGR